MNVKGVILGTAGHIDHGKSSLVKALTGTDPDRLKEEKERGITIDLGFASISYPDGLNVGVVDVPGHEKLIKNMLAGAGGIDIVLMVIAADEGIMPQSREHLAICELLKIKAGIIAITKADLVDDEWLQLVAGEVGDFVKGTFLENAEIIPVSAKTGFNREALKEKIREICGAIKPKMINGLFRLPIDRVFTLKGFGTVVTGTALSGTIALDAPVEILPSMVSSKVRGLQSHGKSVDKAYAGQRIGINLQGVNKESLKRGDVVVPPNRFVPAKAPDVKLEMLAYAPLVKSRSIVHFYSGTSETIARVILYDRDVIKAGESCFCQLRLDEPVVVLSGDRYIIRRFSPLETIGGGEILDPHPGRRKRKEGTDDLIILEKGSLKDKIEVKVKNAKFNGCAVPEIEGWIQGEIPEIKSAVEQLVKEGKLIRAQDMLLHGDSFNAFKEAVKSILTRFHKDNPLRPGMPKEELKAKMPLPASRFSDLISLVGDIATEKDVLRLKDFKVTLSRIDEGMKGRIIDVLNKDGFQPPLKPEIAQKLSVNEKEINDLLKLLAKEGAVVRINDSMYISKEQYDKMIGRLRDFYSEKKEMTVAEFRDILGTSRKYALPLLEYLDSNKITLRVGDIRKFVLK
ncbi:MAG TPA: selenocysteine-specific translation elongation factor [Nitrospiraceae bacterium]|nr:MAG: selenocysteine-specific translation elongation factor [Nitrospirae bacterium GWA2_46_11]OGW23688.1 MAG: selenocysteine-specific translation elongation factor [Nitrospirae bacterium GWB2_47_37]HAK89191.1 selenocysteine-specific translation elongation factor [Nitrospiraceae bacterium]HCZ11472.1 selenocysteine-specific translation elongation factor [Nitrospiraceae bacterium]